MKTHNCPGCLREGFGTYCTTCRRKLFNGTRVDHILSFSRPEYNQHKILQKNERMSISGVQAKHSLRLDGKVLNLVEHGGEYILKPIPNAAYDNIEHVPANEHLTMQLAKQMFTISTAENSMIFFKDGSPAYLTKRFDVLPDGKKSLQEDMAQIANKSEEKDGKNYKYDFSYEGISELMRQYVGAYAVEAEKFFKIIIFNYYVQNGDAHLKNFSLMRSEEYGDYHLSPAYDLVNTKIHLPQEGDTALEIFKGDFQTESYGINGKYCMDDFTEFGKRLGLKERRMNKILREFTRDNLHEVEGLIMRSFLSDELKKRYVELVKERIARLEYSFSEEKGKEYGNSRNQTCPR